MKVLDLEANSKTSYAIKFVLIGPIIIGKCGPIIAVIYNVITIFGYIIIKSEANRF